MIDDSRGAVASSEWLRPASYWIRRVLRIIGPSGKPAAGRDIPDARDGRDHARGSRPIRLAGEGRECSARRRTTRLRSGCQSTPVGIRLAAGSRGPARRHGVKLGGSADHSAVIRVPRRRI